MFDEKYIFRGKHAEMVRRLTAELDGGMKGTVFKTNYDVYAVAPIVGVMYNKKAVADKAAGTAKVTIPADKIASERSQLMLNYRIVMMHAFKGTKTLQERMEIAFNSHDAEAPYDKLYDAYVLGGVEIIYDKIFTAAESSSDILNNMYCFFEEINSKYYML